MTPPTPTATPPTSSTAPPARQSCDRCHKQKLRCTRENNSNGGVCDRCFRKRIQCVYSFSLPKGRPSLYRLEGESTTNKTGGKDGAGSAHQSVKPTATAVANWDPEASDADANADGSTRMNENATQVANPSTDEHSDFAGLMDTSMDVSTDTWPGLDPLSWDDDRSTLDLSCANAVVASLDDYDPASSTRPPGPPSLCHPHAYGHGQPGRAVFEEHHGSSRSHMGKDIAVGGDGTMNMSLDNYMNRPSLFITQLSQLSSRLSSLRYESYTLAKAALSPSWRLSNDRQMPLIDAAAFESVGAWLAHGQDSANMNAHPSVHTVAEGPDPHPSLAPGPKPGGGHGILHDVFSASHRLLEILRHLQVKSIVEPCSSSTTTSASTPPADLVGHDGGYLGLTNDSRSTTPSSGSQRQSGSTMQIIRHLVMACEALLLEIYMAVLIALQHDAYHGAAMNTMALGDVRLVLVVQLCSYLIESQHQAVDLCLTPQSPLRPLSVSGMRPLQLDHFGAEQLVPPVYTTEREVLGDLRHQVQQRLAHLRQTLRFT
ncbi:MAG: hypothetical protein Q9196_001204 [Gyalolechia fulgens]